MTWYNYVIYLAILVGIVHLVWGVHNHKKFALGLIIIISAFIAKAFIWILDVA